MPVLQPRRADADADGEGVRGKVRFVWKNYPLPFHNNAEPAAEAAMAAGAQGKFWQMHDKLFENQHRARPGRPSRSTRRSSGLDVAKFKADLDAEQVQGARSRPRRKEGQAVGVERHAGGVHQRTQDLRRAYPFETFKKIADEELAKKTGKKTAANRPTDRRGLDGALSALPACTLGTRC